MKLEQQVCSLELAQKLKELGVKQESLFYWKSITGTKEGIFYNEVSMHKTSHIGGVGFELLASAFTVAELGEIILSKGRVIDWRIDTFRMDQWNIRLNDKGEFIVADTEADARAKMLIYLIENKLITV